MFPKISLLTLSLLAMAACGLQEPDSVSSLPPTIIVAFPDAQVVAPSPDAGVEMDAGTATVADDAGMMDAGVVNNPDATVVADAGNAPLPGTGPLPDPFKVGTTLKCNSRYIAAGVTRGQLRGSLPGSSWTSGPVISDPSGDGYMVYTPSGANRTALNTVSVYSVQATNTAGQYMLFGNGNDLCRMSPAARAVVGCNRDAQGHPNGCEGRVTWNGSAFVGAGNMQDFPSCL